MQDDALSELEAAFLDWRRGRAHIRESAPRALMERARSAVERFGVAVVARATGVDRRRLVKVDVSPCALVPAREPVFTRVRLSGSASASTSATAASDRAFAEVEAPNGLRVRLLSSTPEAVALLASVLGVRGPA